MADLTTTPPNNNTQQSLQNLSNQLPVASQRIAQGQAAARNMQLQNAVQAASPSTNTTQTAQQTGAAQATQAGQQQVQQAQAGLQQQAQVAQLGLAQQQQQGQQAVASQSQGAQTQATTNLQRMAAVDQKAKQDIYDANIQFQKDEAGRTLFNTTQLMDYQRLNAQSNEQYQNAAQAAQQLSQRNLQAMQASYNKITQDLNNKYLTAKAQNDFKTVDQITRTQEDLKRQMADASARSENQNAMLSAGMGALGPIASIGMRAFGGGGSDAASSAATSSGGSDAVISSTTEAAGADAPVLLEDGAAFT